jgi:hypothetical protein
VGAAVGAAQALKIMLTNVSKTNNLVRMSFYSPSNFEQMVDDDIATRQILLRLRSSTYLLSPSPFLSL